MKVRGTARTGPAGVAAALLLWATGELAGAFYYHSLPGVQFYLPLTWQSQVRTRRAPDGKETGRSWFFRHPSEEAFLLVRSQTISLNPGKKGEGTTQRLARAWRDFRREEMRGVENIRISRETRRQSFPGGQTVETRGLEIRLDGASFQGRYWAVLRAADPEAGAPPLVLSVLTLESRARRGDFHRDWSLFFDSLLY